MDYGDSLELNDTFLLNMISSLNILNERSKSISIKMRRFTFIKPSSSIIQTIQFIENNQEKFNKIGWYLSIQRYKDAFGGHCDQCLCIAPLKN